MNIRVVSELSCLANRQDKLPLTLGGMLIPKCQSLAERTAWRELLKTNLSIKNLWPEGILQQLYLSF